MEDRNTISKARLPAPDCETESHCYENERFKNNRIVLERSHWRGVDNMVGPSTYLHHHDCSFGIFFSLDLRIAPHPEIPILEIHSQVTEVPGFWIWIPKFLIVKSSRIPTQNFVRTHFNFGLWTSNLLDFLEIPHVESFFEIPEMEMEMARFYIYAQCSRTSQDSQRTKIPTFAEEEKRESRRHGSDLHSQYMDTLAIAHTMFYSTYTTNGF